MPADAYPFAESLTSDLLGHGYSVLAQTLRLREMGGAADDTLRGLLVAAESIESAVRRGLHDNDRDFHLVMAACAFHLARYGARAFCLSPAPESHPNLSTPELVLVRLMRRSLGPLRQLCARWLRDESHQDDALAGRLDNGDADALLEVEVLAITTNFVRALATFLTALERGDVRLSAQAATAFSRGESAALECHHIPLWWANVLARHLTDDLWANSLHTRLPSIIDGPSATAWARLRDRYISVLRSREAAELDLWPSQWEAAERCVDPTDDLVVALPTSAGKTRVAELCILRALADERRVVYVTPLRALSAQLEHRLGRTFRPLGHSVTALYGASGVAAADIATLRDARIVVATPEKLDFALRVDPSVLDDVGLVVLDEGHMIGLGTREVRYEVLVQRLLRRTDADTRRIVCLSAVFSPSTGTSDVDLAVGEDSERSVVNPFTDFTAWLRTDVPGTPVTSSWRPTRQRSGILQWNPELGGRLVLAVDGEMPYVRSFVPPEAAIGMRKKAFPKDANELVIATAKAFLRDDNRVLIYCPKRASVETLGKAALTAIRQGYLPRLLSVDVDITRALSIGREWLGETHVALRALEHGVAIHHGTLPRAFLSEIEDLLQRRQLRLVIASPTLAQGIDLSCSVLIFRSLYRERDNVISPEEYSNVVGRAGRAYADLDGISVFPIFEGGWRGRKQVREYNELLRDSASRRLESGLVLLVEQLIEHLASGLGVPKEGVRQYVLDSASAWDVEYRPPVDGDEREGDDLIAPELADLDAALLSSIEQLDCTVAEVATMLDESLRASLWARRLARRPNEAADLAHDVIVGRARWMWTRSTPSARRGYHAAGIGYAAGRFLDEHAVGLVAQLQLAENALAAAEISAVAAAVVEIAKLLRNVPPFAFEHVFPGWEVALKAWIVGEPVTSAALHARLGSSETRDIPAAVPFIQQDIVYHLVWGVEAVRLHGEHLQTPGADTLTGAVALALTYGTCSPAGAVLAQAGLPSRAMISHVLERFPGTFTSPEGMRNWLAEYGATLDSSDFWPDNATAAIWTQFRRRWTGTTAVQWQDRFVELAVTWAGAATPPAPGTRVALIRDAERAEVSVCDASLMPLGHLTTPYDLPERGTVTAHVSSTPGLLAVQTFAP
jgi:DEAD/DEAH box helicase